MAQQREQYRLKSGDDIGNPQTLNKRFFDIDLRLNTQEQIEKSWVAALDELQRVGLARIDEVLLPVFNKIAELAQLGAMFTATSPTEVEISVGLKRLIIDEASREMYAPAAFVAAFVDGDLQKAMLGTVLGYDIASGELELDVHRVSGTGSGANWVIHAASATDNAEAAFIAEQARDDALEARDNVIGIRDYVDQKHAETDAFRDAAAASAGLANTRAGEAETARIATEAARDQALAAVTSVTTAASTAITTVNTAVAAAQTQFQADIDAAEAELTATAAAASTNLQSIIDDGTADIVAAFSDWNGRYLGAYATDPATGFEGAALTEGLLYWNATVKQLKAYDGVGWVAMVVPAGSEVVAIFGRAGNVSAQTGDYSANKITVTPAGTIAATDVQTALEEVAADAAAALTAGLAGKAATAHVHAIADITALQGVLDGKAPVSHTHAWSDVTGTPTTLTGYGITIASTAEAQAGTDNVKPMTALRVKEAIPQRLKDYPTALTDFATTYSSGWYTLNSGSTGQPSATGTHWAALTLPGVNANNQVQIAIGTNGGLDDIYMRERINTAWGGWSKLQWTQAEQDARYAQLSGATFTAAVTVSAAAAVLALNETDAAVDARRWQLGVNGGIFQATVTNDANTAAAAWLSVVRGVGNTVDSIDLFATAFTKNGNVVWHAGNDGAGSGLDADLLDGVQGADYARADASNIGGRLGTTAKSVAALDWNSAAETGWWMSSSTTNGPLGADTRWWLGEVVVHTADWITQTVWDFAGDRKIYRRDKRGGTWQAWVQVAGADGKVWHADNDGAASGLDADLLDGMHASEFAAAAHTHDDRYYTETEVNTLLGAKSDTSHTHAGVYLPVAGKAADASLLNGAAEATAATANSIAKRDASGNLTMAYGNMTYANMSHAATTRNADTVFYSSTDAFVRKNTAGGFRTSLSVYSKAEVDAAVAAAGPNRSESADLSWASSTAVSFAHGLGAVPSRFGSFLKCKVANNGYAVGDRVDLPRNDFVTLVADASSVTVSYYSNSYAFPGMAKAGGGAGIAFATSQWDIVLWAEE